MALGWTKAAAVEAIIDLNLRRSWARGKGKKAAVRVAAIELAREHAEADAWHDSMRLTEQDMDTLAERYTEGRTFMSRMHSLSHA